MDSGTLGSQLSSPPELSESTSAMADVLLDVVLDDMTEAELLRETEGPLFDV
jgi:hypothetical protein